MRIENRLLFNVVLNVFECGIVEIGFKMLSFWNIVIIKRKIMLNKVFERCLVLKSESLVVCLIRETVNNQTILKRMELIQIQQQIVFF
jgi:hypothetical protein